MVSYFVRYRGSCVDPDGFHAHYESHHAEILRGFPRIRSLILHRPIEWTDPFPISRGGSFLLAQMTFDGVHDLDAALRSEARQRARDDFQRLSSFGGEVTHEAMSRTVVF